MTRYLTPSLTLTFLAENLGVGMMTTLVVESQYIERHSITYQGQLLSGMRPSSNQLSLTLAPSCPAIEAILATDGDIKAIFKDGTIPIFTGYLSTNHTWTLTDSGSQAMRITLEDVGTRLLGRPFLQKGRHLFNCSATQALRTICNACSIAVSSACPPLSQTVIAVVDDRATCGELLERLLFELGHVYHFDNLGHLMVHPIDCNSVENVPVLDKEDLCTVGGKALIVSKKIRQYSGARVSFTRLATATDFLVYRNTTGRDNSHPYCNMPLEGGQYFDGTEVYGQQEWEDEQSMGLRSPALIEACNAGGETELVGGARIISVSNVRTTLATSGGTISASVEGAGGPMLKVQAHNASALTYHITRLDAHADILYEQDTNIVRTRGISEGNEISQNLVIEELFFIHSITPARSLANLIGQYHRHAGCTYTFYSERDLAMGTIVKLIDNAFTGLSVTALITAKSFTDGSAVSQYQGVGISVFNLDAETLLEVVAKPKNESIGPAGQKGEDGRTISMVIESSNGSTFRPSQVNTTLFCRVYSNTEEITSTLDPSLFQWKRASDDPIDDERWNTSAKAIAHKWVTIGPQNCIGRTVFFCEVDLSTLNP